MQTGTAQYDYQTASQKTISIEHHINFEKFVCLGGGLRGGLSCFLYNENGDVVAALCGYTWGDYCQIDDLWVQAGQRGQGYGKQLLQAAEQEALRRGCTMALLDPSTLQSSGFYQKQGYQISSEENDSRVRIYQKVYLKKQLNSCQPELMIGGQ